MDFINFTMKVGAHREIMTSQVLPKLKAANEKANQGESGFVSRVFLGHAKDGTGDYLLSVSVPIDKDGYLETALVGTDGKVTTKMGEVGYDSTITFDKPKNGGVEEVLAEIARVRSELKEQDFIE